MGRGCHHRGDRAECLEGQGEGAARREDRTTGGVPDQEKDGRAKRKVKAKVKTK